MVEDLHQTRVFRSAAPGNSMVTFSVPIRYAERGQDARRARPLGRGRRLRHPARRRQRRPDRLARRDPARRLEEGPACCSSIPEWPARPTAGRRLYRRGRLLVAPPSVRPVGGEATRSSPPVEPESTRTPSAASTPAMAGRLPARSSPAGQGDRRDTGWVVIVQGRDRRRGAPWSPRDRARTAERKWPGSGPRVARRDDARQLQPAAAAGPLEHLVLGLRLLAEAVDRDEAQGGRGVVLVALLVGGQLVPVEAVLALAADDRRRAPCRASSAPRPRRTAGSSDEGHQVLVQGAEPEAVVDQVGVRLADLRLEPERVLREREELDLAVRLVQDDGAPGPRRSRGT